MSVDLAVMAAKPGDLDERIVAFYQELQAIYPDHAAHDDDTPWACAPLDTPASSTFS